MIDLKSLLPKSHFLLHFNAKGQAAIFRALAQPLVDDGIVSDMDHFLADVAKREAQITTQICKEIAMPHARSEAVRRLGITIGITDEPGIPYASGAKNKCRIFFMIAVPSFAPTAHLTLLQGLVHFANDKRRVEKILAAATPAQAATIITTFKWPT
jgi:mannitol/fructose-specific phosphotransferase system IIA component (Ntr-type)